MFVSIGPKVFDVILDIIGYLLNNFHTLYLHIKFSTSSFIVNRKSRKLKTLSFERAFNYAHARQPLGEAGGRRHRPAPS